MITAKRLRELLSYDPETGGFTRLVRMGRCPAGETVFGAVARSGDGRISHRVIGAGGKNYLAHRLAWLYVHGKWPDAIIDHKNGDPLDNRLCNLREATPSQNSWNMRLHSRSSSGLKGAYKHSLQPGKWIAIICKNRKQKNLGTFDTKEAAHAAYCAAARDLFGEFARAA